MTILSLIVDCLILVGLLGTVIPTDVSQPEGYEDELGFHYGHAMPAVIQKKRH